MSVIGIDPGLDGALVVYAHGRIVEQHCTRDLCPDGYVPEQMDGLVGQRCPEPDAAAVLCVALDLNARQCLELYEACGIPTPDPVWQAVNGL
jgi:hypothetical protein